MTANLDWSDHPELTGNAQPASTIDRLRQQAAAHEAKRQESFERCDTDGFLSQWASGLNAQLRNRQADILESGGKTRFVGLWEGARRVKAREIETQFGDAWLLHEDEARLIKARGKKFLPTGHQSRVLKKLGLHEAYEMAPAAAKLDGRGHGLSGSAWVACFRTACKWGGEAEYIRPTTAEDY